MSSKSEIVAAFAHRADTPLGAWWALIEEAERQIDLLGFALQFLPEQHPRLLPELREKARAGCEIRIAVCDPTSQHVGYRDREERLDGTLAARIRTALKHFEPLLGLKNISIHVYDAPPYNSVFRCDDEMFVTPHLYGLPGYKAPLLHIRRLGEDGMFDCFAKHFEDLWDTSSPAYQDRRVDGRQDRT